MERKWKKRFGFYAQFDINFFLKGTFIFWLASY